MQINVEQIPGEAVFVLTASGHVKDGVDFSIRERLQAAAATTDGLDYVIIDAREVASSFEDVLAFQQMLRHIGTMDMSHIKEATKPPVFVGSNQFVDLYIQKVLPLAFGSDHAPVFRSVEDALDYIHWQKAQQQ